MLRYLAAAGFGYILGGPVLLILFVAAVWLTSTSLKK